MTLTPIGGFLAAGCEPRSRGSESRVLSRPRCFAARLGAPRLRARAARIDRKPWLTAALAAAALAAFLLPGAAAQLEYTREAIFAGEVWRTLGSHLTHWSGLHLVWDWLAFVALGGALEGRGRARLCALLGLAAAAIPVSLLALDPGLTHYRGLSGLDSALFGLAWLEALRSARRRRAMRTGEPFAGARLWALLLLGAGFAAKLGWELTRADAFFLPSGVGFEPVPLAHAVGASVGLLVGTLAPEHAAPQARRGPLEPAANAETA